jgi:hypothetical protein
VAQTADATTVTLHPSADTTLFETYPDNNFGRYYLVAGTTAKQGNRSRALVKFIPGTNVPPGSVVSSVQLTFQVNRSPHTPVSSTFDLYPMLVNWNEGTGGSGVQTKGSAAKTGESTWDMQFAPSTAWSTPGGAAGTEFASTPSASAPISSRLVFSSTPQLVADFQSWVDNPSSNFGWILITESEDVAGTARRFGSREFSSIAPALVVNFTANTPEIPPQVTSPPQDQTVYAGEAATLSVVATGTTPLTYVWAFGPSAISGATNASLTLSGLQATNSGTYSVTVSNQAGSKSASANLAVIPAPTITSATLTNSALTLTFPALPQHNYNVQAVSSLPASRWLTLTNVAAPPAATNVTISDPISVGPRFYRLEAAQSP